MAYSQTLSATGDAPISWSIATGLPTGLTLNASTGAITGTPTTANTFSFTVKATNSEGDDSKALSIVIVTDTRIDFTQPANYQLLGLQSSTVYGSVTFNGSNVIAAMDARWDNAQTLIGGDGTTKFYPVSTAPTVTGITVDGETNLNGVGIYGQSPQMIFFIKGSKLTIWGWNKTSEESSEGPYISIRFDIAIIENSSNKGWLNQGTGGTPYKTLSYSYYEYNGVYYGENRVNPYTLSDLTGGTISTASQLTGYSVYIIVRTTSLLSAGYGSDFNTSNFKDRNVIKPVLK